MSKIGDINGDYFNDLAVSAPMEGGGVVYIFLGTTTGISVKPVQKIVAPMKDPLKPLTNVNQSMFGFSISGVADINSNGYNDIAIGSPDSERVFVYKTYPVVQVHAEVSSNFNPIALSNHELEITVCIRYINNRNFSEKLGE
jgi:hypothetical protein